MRIMKVGPDSLEVMTFVEVIVETDTGRTLHISQSIAGSSLAVFPLTLKMQKLDL